MRHQNKWVQIAKLTFKEIPESLAVHVLAGLTGLTGLVNLLSAVTPSIRVRVLSIDSFIPVTLRFDARVIIYLCGIALLLLSPALWRRKHNAWWIALVVLVISSLAYIVKGLDYERSALAVIVAICLFVFRFAFHARSDKPSTLQGIRVAIISLILTGVYSWATTLRLDNALHLTITWPQSLYYTFALLVGDSTARIDTLPSTFQYFIKSIIVIQSLTLGYAILLMLRPVLLREGFSQDSLKKAERIIKRFGFSNPDYINILPGRSYFFRHDCVICYRVKNRTAVVLGDPIGPDHRRSDCLSEFIDFCRKNDWRIAFYQTREEFTEIYQKFGLNKMICIGQEALIETKKFTLEGSERKKLRNAYNRIERLGYFVRIYPPTPIVMLDEFKRISDEWLTNTRASEKYFSMGYFDQEQLNNGLVFSAFNGRGEMVAFVTVISQSKEHGLTVDLMRYSQKADNGVMEYLLVKVIEYAKENRYHTVSLGLSALSGLDDQTKKKFVGWISHFIFTHFNHIYNFKGLYAFKNKFLPQWQPRYLIYQNDLDLPIIVLALIRADSAGLFA